MLGMCVVNLTLGLFVVFFFCDGLYLTAAYSIMSRRYRSGLSRIESIARIRSSTVDVEVDSPSPVAKNVKSKKSISFVPSLSTLGQSSSSSSSHDSSNDMNALENVDGTDVLDADESKSHSNSRNSTDSSGSSSSSIGELMMKRNRLFLESLKLRKDAIETVLNDPRITSHGR